MSRRGRGRGNRSGLNRGRRVTFQDQALVLGEEPFWVDVVDRSDRLEDQQPILVDVLDPSGPLPANNCFFIDNQEPVWIDLLDGSDDFLENQQANLIDLGDNSGSLAAIDDMLANQQRMLMDLVNNRGSLAANDVILENQPPMLIDLASLGLAEAPNRSFPEAAAVGGMEQFEQRSPVVPLIGSPRPPGAQANIAASPPLPYVDPFAMPQYQIYEPVGQDRIPREVHRERVQQALNAARTRIRGLNHLVSVREKQCRDVIETIYRQYALTALSRGQVWDVVAKVSPYALSHYDITFQNLRALYETTE